MTFRSHHLQYNINFIVNPKSHTSPSMIIICYTTLYMQVFQLLKLIAKSALTVLNTMEL